jgi:hypothetical protein
MRHRDVNDEESEPRVDTRRGVQRGPAENRRDTEAAWIFSSSRRHRLRRSCGDVRDIAIGNGVVKPCGARYRSSASMVFP